MEDSSNGRILKVLIADDLPSIRQALSTMFALIGGLEVVGEAANGEEAVRLTKALRPDVVVMDLEMPVLGGFEATRRIKEIYPDCRVVVLTIHEGEEERRMAYGAGVDTFVIKGAPMEELIARIRGDS